MKKLMLMSYLFLGIAVAVNAQTHAIPTDPVMKAKGLQKELKLTDAQTTKVAAIYTESAKKFDEIKVKEKGNNDKMLVAIRPLRLANVKKIKAVLTPPQVAKYDKLIGGKNEESSGWSDGWSSSASN